MGWLLTLFAIPASDAIAISMLVASVGINFNLSVVGIGKAADLTAKLPSY
jgi:hypothetical protein